MSVCDYLLVADTWIDQWQGVSLRITSQRAGSRRDQEVEEKKQRAHWWRDERFSRANYQRKQLLSAQINSELRRRLPAKPEIHDRTVSRTLDGMLFQVKLVRPLPADRNRPDVLNKQVDYANWIMNHAIVRHCVFVDECGYNIWTARSHGRARREGVPPSVRPAWMKPDRDNGNIAHKRTCVFISRCGRNERWTF